MSYLLDVWFQNQFALIIVWILGVFAILGLALELKSRSEYTLASCFFIVALAVLNFMFWGAFIHFHLAQLFIYLMGAIALVRQRNQIIQLKVEVLSITVLAFWFACVSAGSVPFSWDEFFWSLFDKHIAQFSHYWKMTSAVLVTHIRYMPGSALWHNFFGVKGYYLEATSYFANSILLSILIYWLSEFARKTNRLFLIAIIVISLGSFSEGWFSLYMDVFVGLFLCISMLAAYRYFKGDKNSLLIFVLSITGSILVKETGIIPFLALISTIVASLLLRIKIEFKKLALAILYCFALIISWKYYLKFIEAPNILTLSLFTDFSDEMTQHYFSVITAFLKYAVSGYAMIAIWIMCVISIIKLRSMEKQLTPIIYFIFCILGFVSLHLVSWLFLVGKDDGLGLAANTRYMGSLLMAIYIFCAVLYAEAADFKLSQKILLVLLLTWVPINLMRIGIKPSSLFRLFTPHPKQVPLIQKQMTAMKKNIPDEVLELCKKEQSKIWFIYQNSNGFEAMVARHLLTPCQVSYGSWSLGDRYYETDVWTANYSDENFLNHANKYPYLIGGQVDQQFIDKYGKFFTSIPQTGKFYAFDKANQVYDLKF